MITARRSRAAPGPTRARRAAPGIATRLGNAVGYCFAHARARHDADGDAVAEAPWPRCITLTDEDVLPPVRIPPVSDALELHCVGRTTLPGEMSPPW